MKKKETSPLLKKSSLTPRFHTGTLDFFPLVCALILLALTTFAFFNKGAATWAFNSVVYPLHGWGYWFTAPLIILLLTPSSLNPARRFFNAHPLITAISATGVVLVFLCMFLLLYPTYPILEGDGISDGRLSGFLAKWVEKQYKVAHILSFQLVWKGMAPLYAIFSACFAFTLFQERTDKLLGMIYLLSFPAVLNFLGYYDSYAVFYVIASVTIACLYLTAKQRSWLWFIPFLVFFALCFAAHYREGQTHPLGKIFAFLANQQLSLGLLIFPAFWIFFSIPRVRRLPVGGQQALALGALLLTIAASIAAGANQLDVHKLGFMFNTIRSQDSLFAALYHPFILLVSFLFSYFIMIAAVLVGSSRLRVIEQGPLAVSAFYGTLTIVTSFYVLQILTAVATYEMLDFVCQAGCLGAMIAVPALIFLAETPWKRLLPGLVALNLFISVPAVMVHTSPAVGTRLLAVLPGERSVTGFEMSPYVHAGLHLKDEAHGKTLCYRVFEAGANDRGYYASYASLNLYYLVSWQYEFGDIAQARANLIKILRKWPEKSVGLLNPKAGFTSHSAVIRIQDYGSACVALARETKHPIYVRLAELAQEVLNSRTPAPKAQP